MCRRRTLISVASSNRRIPFQKSSNSHLRSWSTQSQIIPLLTTKARYAVPSWSNARTHLYTLPVTHSGRISMFLFNRVQNWPKIKPLLIINSCSPWINGINPTRRAVPCLRSSPSFLRFLNRLYPRFLPFFRRRASLTQPTTSCCSKSSKE